MRIVFMGTPEFAVPSLQILVENGHEVVGVITATDKFGGRGGKRLIESAVKKYAVEAGIPILQPRNLKAPEFIEELARWKADLQVVVAFRMLPEVVWDMPPLGTINLHSSLLPKYRGAAPINWAVIRGEKETGVTTFFLKHQIDTGDLLLQRSIEIGPDETAGELHDRLMRLGAETLLESVNKIKDGDYKLTAQDETLVSKAPKIFRDTCRIDFNQSAESIHNFIRGMSPYPAAWMEIDDKEVKVFRSKYEICSHDHAPGSLLGDGKKTLKAATQDGYIHLLEIKMQGRKKMAISDFLNGYGDKINFKVD